MTCGRMNVMYAGTNQVERLVAWNEVIIKNDTNMLRGGHAVFEGTNSVLEMTEKPAWANGLREGKGNVIRVNTSTNEMLVHGNASMRLPANELARAADPRSASTNKPPAKTGTNQWAEVFSEEYTLRPQTAQFRGGVYASHPQMNWASETLTVTLPPEGGQVDHIVAEQSVVFDLLDDKGQKLHGTGDKTVYSYTVSGGTTNDLLELTGAPGVLQSTNGTTRNKIIIFDRLNHLLKTPGDYSISGVVPSQGSNALVLPKPKLTK
jgi:lipopolysaccharide export system protein LptA